MSSTQDHQSSFILRATQCSIMCNVDDNRSEKRKEVKNESEKCDRLSKRWKNLLTIIRYLISFRADKDKKSDENVLSGERKIICK